MVSHASHAVRAVQVAISFSAFVFGLGSIAQTIIKNTATSYFIATYEGQKTTGAGASDSGAYW